MSMGGVSGPKRYPGSRPKRTFGGRYADSSYRSVRPGYTRTSGYYGRPEVKFFDVTLDDATVDNAGTVTDSINKIAQGTTEVQRDGRKCTISSIDWKYDLRLPERDAVATPEAPDVVRVIMYVDKQANGATAAVTDILETANYQSFYNLANSQRFRILCDKTHNMNYSNLASDGAGVVSSSGVVRSYTFHKSLKLPLEFSATTGAITEIRSNNIGVLLISRNAVTGFVSQLRLRFLG